ncbi:MAG TPA: hypothetical protein VFS05_04275 [Gemmatimonadaceae bacterium]|nr:hypothetical protein [Gemmatimonadaceae bacterium]
MSARPASQRSAGAPSATERAEEILDGLGVRIGEFISGARPRLQRLAALAREEAEDIWAEAQQLRAAERVPGDAPGASRQRARGTARGHTSRGHTSRASEGDGSTG